MTSAAEGASSPDVIVVGGGVMGAWTAFFARRAGLATTLVDAYGPGNARATSSDVSRTIRSAHGADAFYATWARDATADWRDFGLEWGTELLIQCGTLWFTRSEDGFEAASEATLRSLGIPVEHLSPGEIAARWPGVATDDLAFGLSEPEGGAIRAQDGVRAVADAFVREGGSVDLGVVRPGRVEGDRLVDVVGPDGARRPAGSFVFACGPWLPRLFPDVLGSLIRVTKQDVVYMGPAGGDGRWTPDAFPTWVEYGAAMWGLPDVDGHGFKVGPDRYGPLFDPSNGERVVDPESLRLVREYVGLRFPGLVGRPVVETRVCQYETTPDTQFVIDRHPAWSNVWLVGGGSGHGFKHGPQIGRSVAARLQGAPPRPGEDRFSLSLPRTAKVGLRTGGDMMTSAWQAY